MLKYILLIAFTLAVMITRVVYAHSDCEFMDASKQNDCFDFEAKQYKTGLDVYYGKWAEQSSKHKVAVAENNLYFMKFANTFCDYMKSDVTPSKCKNYVWRDRLNFSQVAGTNIMVQNEERFMEYDYYGMSKEEFNKIKDEFKTKSKVCQTMDDDYTLLNDYEKSTSKPNLLCREFLYIEILRKKINDSYTKLQTKGYSASQLKDLDNYFITRYTTYSCKIPVLSQDPKLYMDSDFTKCYRLSLDNYVNYLSWL